MTDEKNEMEIKQLGEQLGKNSRTIEKLIKDALTFLKMEIKQLGKQLRKRRLG